PSPYPAGGNPPHDDDLERAQIRKYHSLLDRLGAEPGTHVLEIGCGWGGFAEVAARRGIRVTGITLSEEQFAYARERMRRQGLDGLVEIRLMDYRDLDQSYDHVVSIEMFEAVGERFWQTYFDTVRRVLQRGGKAALQVITLDDAWFRQYRTPPDFIQCHVFPGGMLPSVNRFSALAQHAGLTVEAIHFHGRDYARTLEQWHQRFRNALPEIRRQGFDATFIRLWRYYLAYCEAGFRCGRINLMQVTLG
ncbi:MAG: cyclopropane-fatty-acyl-phospholipid synthase family protein, partial [Ectothiorhodospiraceae bacterium]|nr:cyclopropane-fatty-acyl-phospholipid synthase family protein [Ectothiorhodospiraceae bacterium]